MEGSEDYVIDTVYDYKVNGIPVKTGDLICTVDGDPFSFIGQFWWVIGKLIPGGVDHIAIYVGPGGRCVEAGAKGRVITFDVPNGQWDAQAMFEHRWIMDELYGVAYPLAERGLTAQQERDIRIDVGNYCLQQAKDKKLYNLNFYNSDTEDAFYCSQLAYKAYIHHNINLNTNKEIPHLPLSRSIVFPQEVWASCHKVRVHGA
jgi:hypothetical protein